MVIFSLVGRPVILTIHFCRRQLRVESFGLRNSATGNLVSSAMFATGASTVTLEREFEIGYQTFPTRGESKAITDHGRDGPS